MAKMPPPEGPGLAIVVEAPKSGKKMPPPGSEEPEQTGKDSPEEACVVRADAHCIDCANYTPESGECSKVDGVFDPDDGCAKYFAPEHDEAKETPEDEAAEGHTGKGGGPGAPGRETEGM